MSDLNVDVKIKSHINPNSPEKLELYRLIARAVFSVDVYLTMWVIKFKIGI